MTDANLSTGQFTKEQTEILQAWQDHYCRVTGVYAFCLDEDGLPVTQMNVPDADREKLDTILTPERVKMLFTRVSRSMIEDQAVEDTDYPNARVAASAFKDEEGRALVVWIICALITKRDRDAKNYAMPMLDGMSRYTTEARMFEALDLLRESMRGLFSVTRSRDMALAISEQSKSVERHMTSQLHRAEAMTRIISLIDSDDQIDAILEEALGYISEYLGVSHAFLVHLHKSGETINITLQWQAEDEERIFIRTEQLERYWFLNATTPQVISSGTPVSAGEREELDMLGIRALAVVPVMLSGAPAFYACFAERHDDRVFSVDDMKFLSDAIRILQSILTKRNQKNSLIGSYAALESMLDNIGSSIYVRDVATNALLFANRSLRNHFSRELRDGTLQELFEDGVPAGSTNGNYEVCHTDRERFYELYYTRIKWVDFRPVVLCAIYDITEKKVYQKRIEQQAYTDFLTGLYNRMCFERDLAKYVEEAQRTGRHGALMYIDLDDFKHINDGLGHQYGDVLLKRISKDMSRIKGLQGSCYRMGGDEFVAIVRPEVYDRFDKIQKSLKEVFAKPFYLKDADYYCTMSMGIVEFPSEGATVTELIQKADIAMYEAKKSGKNRVAHYTDGIDSISGRRLDMEKNMRNATMDNYREFEIYFQPIVNTELPGAPCMGAEALVRWNSKLGFISPAEFIPLAEYLGLIGPIGNYVLAEACKACARWNRERKPDFSINVNLSVVQLLQPDIVDVVRNALEESMLDPSHLTLEVTESLAINDLDRTKSILMNIKRLGVHLALDDFGTGYSSLNNIRVLPFDVIKVDQNFVKDLADDTYSQSFIRMIAELAEAIDADVCVEGIETEAQFHVLEDMKVKYIQGYWFGKPIEMKEFEDSYILEKRKKKY